MLLSCERYSAEDGDEDEDGGDFKGQQQVAEEDAAEIAGGGEVFAEASRAEARFLRQENVGEEAEESGGPGESCDVGEFATVSTLFPARVEEHDDKGEEDHDGAGIDDDLGGGEEFGSEEQVEHGERAHDDDEREGAVDGMALEQEVQRTRYTQPRENDEESQMHVF